MWLLILLQMRDQMEELSQVQPIRAQAQQVLVQQQCATDSIVRVVCAQLHHEDILGLLCHSAVRAAHVAGLWADCRTHGSRMFLYWGHLWICGLLLRILEQT